MKRAFPSEPPASLVAYEVSPGVVLFVHPIAVPHVEGLSAAEQAVLALVLEGYDTPRIAQKRGTSPRTAANQVASIFRKIGVGSRAELAAKLVE